MKTARHSMILEIIKKKNIETQEELAEELRKSNFDVTQATVSRDIKELRLVKILGENGRYKYATGEKTEYGLINRFMRMFAHSVVSINASNTIIVIRTISGSAAAAAEAIDSLNWPEIIGTIAGDNTIFVACRNEKVVQEVMQRFKNMMK